AVNNNILAISHKSDFAVATLNFSLCFTTSIAKKTIIAILVNSDGWIVINGILLNQLFDPFTGSAIDAGLKCNRTTISKPNIYKHSIYIKSPYPQIATVSKVKYQYQNKLAV